MIAGLIVWLAVGATAGFLAGLIMKGRGFGLAGNIVVGSVGAALASWLLPKVGFAPAGGMVAEILDAVIGAVLFLAVVCLVRKAPPSSVFMGFRPR